MQLCLTPEEGVQFRDDLPLRFFEYVRVDVGCGAYLFVAEEFLDVLEFLSRSQKQCCEGVHERIEAIELILVLACFIGLKEHNKVPRIELGSSKQAGIFD